MYFLCLCAYISTQKMTALEAEDETQLIEYLLCMPKPLGLMTALDLVVHVYNPGTLEVDKRGIRRSHLPI